MGMISRVKLLRVSMGVLCGAGGIDLHLSLGDNKKEIAGIFVPAKFASIVCWAAESFFYFFVVPTFADQRAGLK